MFPEESQAFAGVEGHNGIPFDVWTSIASGWIIHDIFREHWRILAEPVDRARQR
jgi:hypothetical protein